MKTGRILCIDNFANRGTLDSVKLLKRDQVVALLKQKQGDQTNVEFAKKLEIHPSLLCELYRGSRDPGKAVLEFLGLNKRVLYEKTA